MFREHLLTLMVLSLLAQLLMIDRDCWKRVLPIPMTSAISWLTAITTLGKNRKCIYYNYILDWILHTHSWVLHLHVADQMSHSPPYLFQVVLQHKQNLQRIINIFRQYYKQFKSSDWLLTWKWKLFQQNMCPSLVLGHKSVLSSHGRVSTCKCVLTKDLRPV